MVMLVSIKLTTDLLVIKLTLHGFHSTL